ncbi:MAG: ectoine synthase [Hyphomonadaceae bacterium]
MIIRNLSQAAKSARHIVSRGWESTRLILKDDKMGFSFHITRIHAGAELPMHYRNHLESVYCISGTGSIEDLGAGERHAIEPGMLYALDQHDRHVLRAETELVLACVFNPPLNGRETHDESGAYPLEAERVQ